MSNQEQQFYPPGQYPPSSQQSHQYYQPPNSVNVDPHEQQQFEMYGDSEYYTGRGEKLQPHPPRRKGFRAFWLVPIVLLFLIGGMSFGHFAPHNQFSKGFGGPGYDQFSKGFGGPGNEQSFNVGATPKLVINDAFGTVHIHSDSDSSNTGTVTIRIDRSGNFASGSGTTISPDKVAGVITIDATQQGFGDANTDLDITTPSASSIQVSDDNGDVNIEGVTGGINVQTLQGSIDANNVSGQVTLSSTSGDVSIENGSLSGQSSLHSDNGDIRYNGSIDPQGSYNFDTISGSIDVSLPSDTAFHLNGSSANGQVGNEFGSNDFGSGTHPPLTVSSVSGSIHISKNGS